MIQNLYWAKRKARNLIVKCRQGGITKFIDADQLVDCMRQRTNAVVISHEKEATKRLFSAVREYIDNLPVQPLISTNSKSEIKFPKVGSSYYVGTAGARAFARGDTIQRAHLSEAAFYQDLEKVRNGVEEAAEFGRIDIETTPNGHDEVHSLWQKGRVGRSSYTNIFIPWFLNPEYSADFLTEKERKNLTAAIAEMFAVPDEEFTAGMNDEEKNLVANVLENWGIQLTAGQMKWRRYKIWDKGQFFYQEYPEDEESCFLQNERSVFSHIRTEEWRRIPLDNLKTWCPYGDPLGDMAAREQLKKTLMYGFIDGAEGIPDGDQHVFSVIAFQEGKMVVIYEYASREPIDVFNEKVAAIVNEYNIFLGCEKQGIGGAHILKLRSLGLDPYEWNTTGTSRGPMITQLEEAYRKEELIETYPEAEAEARDMEYKDKRAEHRSGKHDDRVFSRAGALQLTKLPVPGVSAL